MSLPSPNLDDRRFQDIVDEAKQRIARYAPEWTDHNVSDPGVALLELFAWMTESILYRLNQVPDAIYVKFLELLGLSLFPAAPARTTLTFWLSTPQEEPVRVPAGTQVGTQAVDGEDPVIFMTDDELIIRPPLMMSALTATAAAPNRYRLQWDELRFERSSVTTFNTLRPGDAIYFGFQDTLASNVVALNVVAETAGIGIDPANPPWSWEVWSGESWIPAAVYEDETGGFNRSGMIVLFIPSRHAPLTLGAERYHWIRCRLAEPAEGQPSYSASPVINTMTAASLGGQVTAHHGQANPPERLGVSDGTPGQSFRVQHWPVLSRRPGETLEIVAPETADGGERDVASWQEARTFANATEDDQIFMWDAASGEIRFGPRIRYPDGTHRQFGAIPPADHEIRVTGYRSGGGRRGNVGRGTLTVLQSSLPFVDRVANLQPAIGGVDPESVDNAKMRGTQVLRTGDRAVTAQDFERLAIEAAPTIARARALPPARPGGPVRVLIVPNIDRPADQLSMDDLAIPSDMFEQVAGYLDERRLLGASIEIGPPRYQGVSVVARIAAGPGRDPDLVRHRALLALYRYLNPISGGPDRTGWPFGRDLNVAQIFTLLTEVEGLARVDEVLLFEVDLATQQRARQGAQQVHLEEGSLFLSHRHVIV